MTDPLDHEPEEDAALVAAARRLGADAADRLDLDRTARRVLERWRAERARVRPFYGRPAFLRIAAVLVLVGAGVVTWRARGRGPEEVAVLPTDAGLEGLSADQLQALLPTVSQPAGESALAAYDGGLEGLSPAELRTLLLSLGS